MSVELMKQYAKLDRKIGKIKADAEEKVAVLIKERDEIAKKLKDYLETP